MDQLPDVLSDGDLRLRPMTRADLPMVTSHLGDQSIARWLAAVAQPFTDQAARDLMAHGAHPGENLRMIEVGDRVAGGLCIGAALWYWLAPEFWRQGLMRRALALSVTARFAGGAPPLIATCHRDNTASRALLSSLGFSASPSERRMFFHGTQRSEPCLDYLMTCEQWHMLYPPEIRNGDMTLRPARQQDAATLALLLPPLPNAPWPDHAALPGFIEQHRFRGPAQGLFLVTDPNRSVVGVVLLDGDHQHELFRSDADQSRFANRATTALLGALSSG